MNKKSDKGSVAKYPFWLIFQKFCYNLLKNTHSNSATTPFFQLRFAKIFEKLSQKSIRQQTSKKKYIHRASTKGMTMVETLVYVSLLALVLTFTVNVLLTVSKTFANLRLSKEINVSANSILDRIIRETRSAEEMVENESIFNVHPGKLTVSRTLPDNSTTKTTFFVEDGALKLWRDGNTIGPLSVNEVTIDSFILSHATSSHSDAIKIDLILSGARGTIIRTEKYHTAAVTRN